MKIPSGTILHKRYRVMQLISDSGGMARVYLVQDTHDTPPTQWALKKLRPAPNNEESEWLRLFDQEASMLEKLQHHNLPKFRERFDDTGRAYLVIEFIQGNTIENLQLHQGGPLDETDVIKWAIQLCQVLEYLHSQNPSIIYRDLKPANIMVTREGIVKVIDFGIARTYKKRKHKDTVLMGTEAYAAPEQYGQGQSDARTDIYALGATMYDLLTNQRPPISRIPGDPPVVRQHNVNVSQKTSDIIFQAMQKDPAKRFQSAKEMKVALRACLPSSIAISAPTPSPPVIKQPEKPCPRCYNLNSATARFCKHCGHSFGGLLPAVLQIVWPYSRNPLQKPIATQQPFTIGRSSAADVNQSWDLSFFDNRRLISRRHAQITVDVTNGQYWITDLDSDNGTWINGMRLLPYTPVILRNGSSISLSNTVVLQFVLTQ